MGRLVQGSKMRYPLNKIRAAFPALSIKDNEHPRIYADNPAGTQVPARVAQSVAALMLENCANLGGHFVTSRAADLVVHNAHEESATFLGARSGSEVIIGPSMTTLTFHLSRSICREFDRGDEIVVTRMEHEGNIAPWLETARDNGLIIRWVPFDEESWKVEPEALAEELSDRTRLVCLNYASNLTGSVNDIAMLTRVAKERGALVFVDAVQLAPHHLIDVQKLGCDFLACSAYKFFGPHLGIIWGRAEILNALHPYKGRCVSDSSPDRFETGTPQLELLAGLISTFDYLADLGRLVGGNGNRRDQIESAFDAIRGYEEPLTRRLITGLSKIPRLKIFGITNSNLMHERVPTVSFRIDGILPSDMAKELADESIFVWHGHNYAYEPIIQLGVPTDEGVVRIGLAHYNDSEEVDRIVSAIGRIVHAS